MVARLNRSSEPCEGGSSLPCRVSQLGPSGVWTLIALCKLAYLGVSAAATLCDPSGEICTFTLQWGTNLSAASFICLNLGT